MPRSAGIFTAQPDSSIKVDWASLKESDLNQTYIFVFTFYDKNNPNSVFKADV